MKKRTNRWSSAKRDDTNPRTTAVYSLMLATICSENVYEAPCAYGRTYVRLERDNNTNVAICAMRRRRQVHRSHIS